MTPITCTDPQNGAVRGLVPAGYLLADMRVFR
jgi:hypothetical protein